MSATELEPLTDVDANEDERASAMKSNRCTDIVCLIVWLAFLVAMGFVLMTSFRDGDIRRLSHGFNFKGELCGVDEAVAGQPYLYYCARGDSGGSEAHDLDFANPICLAKCPEDDSQTISCKKYKEAVDPESSDENGEFTVDEYHVNQASIPTKDQFGRYCVPKNLDLAKSLVRGDGPLGSDVVQMFDSISSLRSCWPMLLFAVLVAVVLGYLYLFALEIVAKELIWGLLVACIVLFFSIGVYCLIHRNNEGGPVHQVVAAYASDAEWTMIGIGVVSLIFGAIFVCVACWASKSIDVAVNCIEGACQCIFDMPSLLLQPLLEAFIRFIVFLFLLYGLLWCLSVGEIKSADVGLGSYRISGLHRTFELTDEEWYMTAFWIFGSLWILEFLTALSQFIVAYSVALWYFTPYSGGSKDGPRFPLFRATCVGLFFHSGSLALGSCLVAMVRMIRYIFQWITKNVKDSNAVAKALVCCISCIMWCFQKFLEFINKNAYIDIAINKNNFCTAGVNVMKILMSEGVAVGILNGATFIAQIVGAAMITMLTFLLAYNASGFELFQDRDSRWYVPDPAMFAAASAFLAFLVAIPFMLQLDMASDTLLMCYVKDKNKGNRGGSHVPKIMADLFDDYDRSGKY
mmetsp:Transcript_10803/g.25860  ORF Transcript_10803/g.25860 Transcript_10803/m.25860 type:complete len:632 (+) Transcript_10803:46-1941(+)